MSFRVADKDSIPGSYELKSLRLFSQTGVGVDLDYMFIEFSIFEDMFGNTISGALTIAESYNIVSNLPIVEGDIVRIHATINSRDEIMAKVDDIKTELKIDLEVIRITDRAIMKKDVSAVTLILASTGWSDNHFQRVSRSFNQLPYSDMVDIIFKENFQTGGLVEFVRDSTFTASPQADAGWESEKDIEIEPTMGLYNIVVPSWSPLKTFNFLADRSSNHADVSDWLFYEDPEMFRFVSINSRLAMEPVGEHYTQLANIKSGNQLNENIYRNFDSIQYTESGNLLKSASYGMFSNDMSLYNIYNKTLTQYRTASFPPADNYIIKEDFSYIENFDLKEHCDAGKVPLTIPITVEKFGLTPGLGKKTFILEHPLMFDEQILGYEPDKFTRQRSSQIQALKYLKLTASGPGLFSRKIGDKITLNLASPQINSEGGLDRRLRGNYLITALRRVFTPSNHSMTVELTKDNYFSDVSDPIWTSGIPKVTRDPNLNVGGGL